MMMTGNSGLYDVFQKIRRDLKAAEIDSPELEARILIEHVTGFHRDKIILDPETTISNELVRHITELANERTRTRKPIAYLTGYKEFYGRQFFVAQDVLIPRPDSETLIDVILEARHEYLPPTFKCLDLGTGSGCLILTVAAEISGLTGQGLDISGKAIEIARKNAGELNLTSRIDFMVSNWDDQVDRNQRYDLIISNPPYIPHADINMLEPDVKDHEPLTALFADQNGLSAYNELSKRIFSRLTENGRCFVEIGAAQDEDVAKLFSLENLDLVNKHKDLGGHIRILEFVKRKQSVPA